MDINIFTFGKQEIGGFFYSQRFNTIQMHLLVIQTCITRQHVMTCSSLPTVRRTNTINCRRYHLYNIGLFLNFLEEGFDYLIVEKGYIRFELEGLLLFIYFILLELLYFHTFTMSQIIIQYNNTEWHVLTKVNRMLTFKI